MIGKYLLGSADKVLIYNPDPSRGLECFMDDNFASNWNSQHKMNPENVLSRTGYVVMFADCPVLWSSKLQTEIALYTTEE